MRWRLGHASLLPHVLLLPLVFLNDFEVNHLGLRLLLFGWALLQLWEQVAVALLRRPWVQLWLTWRTLHLLVLVDCVVFLLPGIIVDEVLAPILVPGVRLVLGLGTGSSEEIHTRQREIIKFSFGRGAYRLEEVLRNILLDAVSSSVLSSLHREALLDIHSGLRC